jgi:hypothetical protein
VAIEKGEELGQIGKGGKTLTVSFEMVVTVSEKGETI